jgi:hypothetical protein
MIELQPDRVLGDPPPDADPATPERRLELTRSLLVWAINAYEIASHQWSIVNESFPTLEYPKPMDPAEHAAWRVLIKEADEAFNACELTLGQRIQVLFNELAGTGQGADHQAGGYFVPRAVRHQGTTYVLVYDVHAHEPKTNIIATYRDSMTIDLADPPH